MRQGEREKVLGVLTISLGEIVRLTESLLRLQAKLRYLEEQVRGMPIEEEKQEKKGSDE